MGLEKCLGRRIVANVGGECTIWAKFNERAFDAGVLDYLERSTIAEEDEAGLVEQSARCIVQAVVPHDL
jgi:hypothetical protein